MASEKDGVDSVEKMRIRMAAEGYNSMDNNNDDSSLIGDKGINSLIHMLRSLSRTHIILFFTWFRK